MQLQNMYLTLAWVVCIQLAAWGIGRPLFRLLAGKSEESVTAGLDVIFSAALGYIVLAYAAFSLAVLHILYPWIVITVTAACALGGAIQLFNGRPISWPPLSWHDIPLLLAILFAASHIPNALYPVLGHDDNVYHLLIPKVYLEGHALVQLPSNLFANMPHIVEVLYTVPMAIGDFTAPKVLVLAFAFWTIAGLYLFARPLLGRFGAGLMTLIYVSGKNIQFHLGIAHIEPVIGFFLLCACLALLAWRETRNHGFLRIMALMCGFAMASKYSAWFFVAAILAVTAFLVLRQGTQLPPNQPARPSGKRSRSKTATCDAAQASRKLQTLAEIAVIVTALAAPWLIKNMLFTGNPVYPNLYGLFGGAYWSEIQQMHLNRSMACMGGHSKTFFTYLALPWRLLVDDRTYFDCPPWSASLMGLWLVALFQPSTYRRLQGPVLAVSVFGFAFWVLSVQQGRFLVAWIPVVTAAATLALAPLRDRMRTLAIIFCGIMVLGMYQIIAQCDPWAPHFEALTQQRQELIQKNINYVLCNFLNKVVPEDGKVLALWDNRFFFLKRTFQADSVYESPTGLARLRLAGDPAVFTRELIASHFTHVTIRKNRATNYLTNSWTFNLLDDRIYPASQMKKDQVLMTRFINEYLEPVFEQSRNAVYRIRRELVVAEDEQATTR